MKRRKKRKNSKVTLAFVILLSLIVLFFLFNYAYKFLIKNKSLITIKSPTQKTNQVKPETPKYYI
jgi:flagellar basal body-associated protein FliL